MNMNCHGQMKMVMYSPSISSYNEKLRVATHEIGHLWGIYKP